MHIFIRMPLLLFVPDKRGSGLSPKFVVPLESMEVNEESPVTLECKLDGSSPAEVEWLCDGEPLEEDEHLRIERDEQVCRVQITAAELDDEGEYSCIAKNDHGTDSCACELLVNESEGADDAKPENKTVFGEVVLTLPSREGKGMSAVDVRLPTDHVTSAQPVTVTLPKVGIPADVTSPQPEEGPGEGEEIVPTEQEPGQFSVPLDDLLGPADEKPEEREISTAKGKTSGPFDPVKFTVPFDELFKPQTKPDDEPTKTPETEPDSRPPVTEEVQPTSFEPVQFSLPLGQLSAPPKVSPKPKRSQPPRITKELEDAEVGEGEPASLKAEFTSDSKVTVKWLKQLKQVYGGDRVKITTTESSSELVFSVSVLEDEGLYQCSVTNDAGQVRTSAELIVEGWSYFLL